MIDAGDGDRDAEQAQAEVHGDAGELAGGGAPPLGGAPRHPRQLGPGGGQRCSRNSQVSYSINRHHGKPAVGTTYI